MTRSKWLILASGAVLIASTFALDWANPRLIEDNYVGGALFVVAMLAWAWVLITANISVGWKLAGVIPISFAWLATVIGVNTPQHEVFTSGYDFLVLPLLYLAVGVPAHYFAKRYGWLVVGGAAFALVVAAVSAVGVPMVRSANKFFAGQEQRLQDAKDSYDETLKAMAKYDKVCSAAGTNHRPNAQIGALSVDLLKTIRDYQRGEQRVFDAESNLIHDAEAGLGSDLIPWIVQNFPPSRSRWEASHSAFGQAIKDAMGASDLFKRSILDHEGACPAPAMPNLSQ